MQKIINMLRNNFPLIMTKNKNTLLGRWKLKHNCKSEEYAVLNANRDHCGDTLCGDPKKYIILADNLKNKK